MNTKAFAVDGRSFDAGVVPILPDPAPGETPKAELPDPRIATLSRLFTDHLEKNSEDSITCQRLMGQLMAIGKEVDSFIAKQRVSVREKLIELHENVKSEARAKQKEISDMRATAAEWQRDLLKAKDAQARAMSELRTADQKRKGLSRFAERSAFAKADEVVEAAENRVDKTNAKVTAIQQQINNIALTELPRLDRELNEIAAREAELNAAVSGQGYTTELGIIVPPRAPAV